MGGVAAAKAGKIGVGRCARGVQNRFAHLKWLVLKENSLRCANFR